MPKFIWELDIERFTKENPPDIYPNDNLTSQELLKSYYKEISKRIAKVIEEEKDIVNATKQIVRYEETLDMILFYLSSGLEAPSTSDALTETIIREQKENYCNSIEDPIFEFEECLLLCSI